MNTGLSYDDEQALKYADMEDRAAAEESAKVLSKTVNADPLQGLVFIPMRLTDKLPPNWETEILLYNDLIPVDTSLFEERDGALVKIGGAGRLEFNQIIWLTKCRLKFLPGTQ